MFESLHTSLDFTGLSAHETGRLNHIDKAIHG